MGVWYVCVLFLKSWQGQYNLVFFYWRWEKLVYVLSNQVGPTVFNIFTKVLLSNVVCKLKTGNQVGPMVFNIFTKMSLSNVVWKLKTGKKSFLNSVFKHPNMSNGVTQTL